MYCEYFLKINLLNFENLRCNCSTANRESFACLDRYVGLILECKCLADIYSLSGSAGFGVIVAVVIQFVVGPVVSLFTSDATVVVLGSQYIRGYIFDCIFAGVHFCFSGYFCAYGRSGFSFLHNIMSILLVRIPGVYLTSLWFPDTLFPMGIATACGSLLSVIICFILFKWMLAHPAKS